MWTYWAVVLAEKVVALDEICLMNECRPDYESSHLIENTLSG